MSIYQHIDLGLFQSRRSNGQISSLVNRGLSCAVPCLSDADSNWSRQGSTQPNPIDPAADGRLHVVEHPRRRASQPRHCHIRDRSHRAGHGKTSYQSLGLCLLSPR